MISLTTLFNRIRGVTSGVILGRVTTGVGRAELLTPEQIRTLISVYSIDEVDTAISEALTAIDDTYVPFTGAASSIDLNTQSLIVGAVTSSGKLSSSYAGAVSQSVIRTSGLLFTGGDGTTNFPQFLQQPSDATPATDWPTSGVFHAVNASAGFGGRFLDFRVDGATPVFYVSSAGTLASSSIASAGGISANGGFSSNYAAAVGQSALQLTGALLTGGTGTNTLPKFLQQPTGATAVTTWSTAGTFNGSNAANGFTGNFYDCHVNGGASVFKVDYLGNITGNSVTINGNGAISGTTGTTANRVVTATTNNKVVQVSPATFDASGNLANVGTGSFSGLMTATGGINATPRIQTFTNSASPAPDFGAYDQVQCTVNATTTFGAVVGTFTGGEERTIRITDDGTSRTINWNAIYRSSIGVLPTATVASTPMYAKFRYNATDTKWDCVESGGVFTYSRGIAQNEFFGIGAGASASLSGASNTAFGYNTLAANTTGGSNTAFGVSALAANIGGTWNIAFGVNALKFHTAGVGNIATGYRSSESLTSGNYNSTYGVLSMFSMTTGSTNTVIGYQGLYDVTSGSSNTIIGSNTGRGITGGNYNTIIGANVTGLAATLSNQVILADGLGNIRLQFNVAAATLSGTVSVVPPVRTSGVANYFTVTTPTDTGITASTEAVGFRLATGTRTWATTGTVAQQAEVLFEGPTYASASASQTFTDVSTMRITKPNQGANAVFTRPHTLTLIDGTSASSSITGGLIVATTLGTAATSVGVGGGNVNAGGTLTVGGTSTLTGKATVGAIVHTPQTYTPAAAGTATLDCSLGDLHRITMPAGNITIALSSITDGQTIRIAITQDGVGSRTVTWFSTIRWAGGSAPTLTTTAGKRDLIVITCTGSGTYDGFVAGASI